MAAAMTDHIHNNPFGRSTDGHRDDWSAVQIASTWPALISGSYLLFGACRAGCRGSGAEEVV